MFYKYRILWHSFYFIKDIRYINEVIFILKGKRELVALLSLSSWCLVIVVWLFLAVPWVCLQFVIVVFPDHTHLLFLCNPRKAHHNAFTENFCN